jgi:hypothetical protein
VAKPKSKLPRIGNLMEAFIGQYMLEVFIVVLVYSKVRWKIKFGYIFVYFGILTFYLNLNLADTPE